jgi:hypothetical protein
MYIVLDQLNDTSDTGDIYVCTSGGVCTEQGGGGNGRNNRAQRQMVRVINVAGNVLTIDRPLYMPNWRSSQSPQAWWGTSSSALSNLNGIEELSLDGTNGGSLNANITLIFTTNSWIKGVRSVRGPSPRAHVEVYTAARVTIRDSYFYGSVGDAAASTNYGIEMFGAWDNLIENNIVQHRTTPFISDGDSGTVWAYNFAIDDHYNANGTAPGWFQASNYSHEGGNGMILHEGNRAVGVKGDIIHGTSNLLTFFRNQSLGWETGKTAETNPVKVYAYNRYWAFIGNVFGVSGYHNNYQSGNATSIYVLGAGYSSIPADPIVALTTMRWGNYDTVNAAVRFVASEVPSDITALSNPVPATQNLPASFYLSGRPDAWWGTPWGIPKWPPIGPDVSNGNVPNVGGRADKIPAQLCFENTPEDTNYGPDDHGTRPHIFNAGTCYRSVGGGTVPASPTSLIVQ